MSKKSKDASCRGRPKQITEAMVEAGIRKLRGASPDKSRLEDGSVFRSCDRADDEAIVVAVYELMALVARETNQDVAREPGPVSEARRYSEAEVAAAIEKTLDAFSRYLAGLFEPEISEWNRTIFVKRVGQHLRNERYVDPSGLWNVY